MLCRAKASSVSQVGLDAATDSVLFFPTGGVSFCSGVDAPAVRWANRRLHRRHSFTRLLTSPRAHCKEPFETGHTLVSRYCTLVYAQTRSYQDTARRLAIDRRTARAKVDQAWLREIGGNGR